MSLPEPRSQLGQAQAVLVRALTCSGPVPAGFDVDRLHRAAASLSEKRCRETARAWPELARALQERFANLFADFAVRTPRARSGGPLADGRAFVHYLQAADELPEAARLEALRVDLRYRPCPAGLLPRRGPVLKAGVLRCPRRLILAVRLPWLGEWWFSMNLGRRS